jgi:hypothetical protein
LHEGFARVRCTNPECKYEFLVQIQTLTQTFFYWRYHLDILLCNISCQNLELQSPPGFLHLPEGYLTFRL